MANFVEAGFKGDLDADLSKFEQTIKDKVLFSGAAAMASVLYEAARDACPVSAESHYFYGRSSKSTGKKYLFHPGNLKNSLYWVHSPERTTDTKKTYRVSWNHAKAPYGFMVEFGTSSASAHPFMRPAFGRINEAIAAGKARMAQRLASET